MNWKPNRTDKKPIYKQIASYIEEGISWFYRTRLQMGVC